MKGKTMIATWRAAHGGCEGGQGSESAGNGCVDIHQTTLASMGCFYDAAHPADNDGTLKLLFIGHRICASAPTPWCEVSAHRRAKS